MNGLTKNIVWFVKAIEKARGKKWTFLLLSLCSFFVTFSLLSTLGLTPDAPTVSPAVYAASPLVATGTPEVAFSPIAAEHPVKIDIPSIGISSSIANPTTVDIGILDAALLSGAVRYPTSALLGEEGNVILFGHSSYLPIVHNQAYKTFDGIQNLKHGDLIMMYSSNRVYTYTVNSVTKENAESGAIPLTVSGRELTLSTCDSFGTKGDRFVVTADFVSSNPISS